MEDSNLAEAMATARKCLIALAEDIADVARELPLVSSVSVDVEIEKGSIDVDMYDRHMNRVIGFCSDIKEG